MYKALSTKFNSVFGIPGGVIKLLLAIDALRPSEEVLAGATLRPWPSTTSARVITAIEYAAIPEKLWRDAEGRIESVRQAMMRLAEDVTGHVVEQLKESGVAAEAVIKIDDPRFVIVREAELWSADLIFIRAHTYTDFNRWLLGSVANAVLRDGPCSVEIVRTTVSDAKRSALNGMKILIAIDGSESSRSAAHAIASRPWSRGTQVKVISVVEPFVYLIKKDNLLAEGGSEVDTLRAAIKEAEDVIGSAGLNVTSEVMKGHAKEEIINAAKAWASDLVVVGSHGRRGIKRVLLGSVSEAVARHAPCSVEVIRSASATIRV